MIDILLRQMIRFRFPNFPRHVDKVEGQLSMDGFVFRPCAEDGNGSGGWCRDEECDFLRFARSLEEEDPRIGRWLWIWTMKMLWLCMLLLGWGNW